jgi:hypothetical protein
LRRQSTTRLLPPFFGALLSSGCGWFEKGGDCDCADTGTRGWLVLTIDHEEQLGAYRYRVELGDGDPTIACELTAPVAGGEPSCTRIGDGVQVTTDDGGISRLEGRCEGDELEVRVSRDDAVLYQEALSLDWKNTRNDCGCSLRGDAEVRVSF